jgi:hypothetical protein
MWKWTERWIVDISNTIRPIALGLATWVLSSSAIAQEAVAANTVAGETSISAPATPALPQFALLAPPKAPKVTCDGNQLTIIADNSTLGGVLAAVHSCIGVQVDIPEGAAGKRVFENLGPGPSREVLESLLNGTDLNFAIGSSATDPQKVDSILLMLRPTKTLASAVADHALTPARRAGIQTRQNERRSSAPGDDNNQAAAETTDYPAAEDAAAKPADTAKPDSIQAPSGDSAPPASDTPAASTDGAKSPATDAAPTTDAPASQDKSIGEKIADMQQMYQQRRQITQTQNQSQTTTSSQP